MHARSQSERICVQHWVEGTKRLVGRDWAPQSALLQAHASAASGLGLAFPWNARGWPVAGTVDGLIGRGSLIRAGVGLFIRIGSYEPINTIAS